MPNETVSLEDLHTVLNEEVRVRKHLGRMAIRRWSLVSLWGLRLYVVAMLLLFGAKFLHMTGILG